MSLLRQTYQGKDLIIPRETLEAMGFKPGDAVIVRSQITPQLVPVSQKEQIRRREILDRLVNAWQTSDLIDFDQQRQAMWQQWTAFNS